MNRLFLAVLGCLLAAYPFILLFGLKVVPVYYLGLLFIAMAGLRLWFMRGTASGSQLLPIALCVILILVAAYSILSGQPEWFRYYPVAVNGTFLTVFTFSLWQGPPIIERMARVSESELPASAIPYTRKVTIVWSCFFVLNGLAALYTARCSSFEVWAWYNGALAYGLMGTLFAGEWLVRQRVKQSYDAVE